MVYLGICDGNMEEGSFRCDANVSLHAGRLRRQFGTRAEIKNVNSFRFVKQAIEYEIERQTELLDDGGKVVQETRLFDPDTGMTRSMRGKEEAHDYRYFPDPDLVPLVIDAEWIEAERALAAGAAGRKVASATRTNWACRSYDAEVLTAERATGRLLRGLRGAASRPGQGGRQLGDGGADPRASTMAGLTIADCPVTPALLAELLKLVDSGTISGKIAKTVFDEMWKTGKEPAQIVEEQGLVQVSDSGAIETIIDEIIAANPDRSRSTAAARRSCSASLSAR